MGSSQALWPRAILVQGSRVPAPSSERYPGQPRRGPRLSALRGHTPAAPRPAPSAAAPALGLLKMLPTAWPPGSAAGRGKPRANRSGATSPTPRLRLQLYWRPPGPGGGGRADKRVRSKRGEKAARPLPALYSRPRKPAKSTAAGGSAGPAPLSLPSAVRGEPGDPWRKPEEAVASGRIPDPHP